MWLQNTPRLYKLAANWTVDQEFRMAENLIEATMGKEEIYSRYIEGYDVLQRIAKKVLSMNGKNLNAGDRTTYLVAFVHPEVKDMVRVPGKTMSGEANTPQSVLDAYVKEVPVDERFKPIRDAEQLTFLNQPMVNVLSDVSGGIIHNMLNATPRGENEDEGSSSWSSAMFDISADSLRNKVLRNPNYTTYGYIDGVIKRSKGDTRDTLEDLKGAIDPDSLFGFRYSDFLDDNNSMNPGWEYLLNLEHWYYALMTNLMYEFDSAVDSDAMGESIYSFIRALRELLSDSEVMAALKAADDAISNPQVGGMDVADAGELHVKKDEYQLGTLLGMFGSTSNGQDTDTTLLDYVKSLVPEEYAGGFEKLAAFSAAPLGKDEDGDVIPFKVKRDKWRLINIRQLVQDNAQTGDNMVASSVSRQLATKPSQSTSLERLAENKVLVGNVDGNRGLIAFIANLVRQGDNQNPTGSIEAALLKDPSEAKPLIGARETISPDEQRRLNNIGEPPLDSMSRLKNEFTRSSDARVRTDDATPVTVLDPAQSDVKNTVVLPKVSIPLFPVQYIAEQKSTEPIDRKISEYASAMIGYMTIAYNDTNIDKVMGIERDVNEEAVDGKIQRSVNMKITGTDIEPTTLTNAINRYIKTLVTSSEITNAVRMRNLWVETIFDAESMNNIVTQVYNFLCNYIDNHVSNQEKRDMYRQRLYKVTIDSALKHVKRTLLNIKKSSYDYDLGNNLVALSVQPIAPVILAESGRRRKSGGTEGSVTSDGKELMRNTYGLVTDVKHTMTRTQGTDERHTTDIYTVVFKNKNCGLPAANVTSDQVDKWIPNGLILVPDAALNKALQYSLWVGVDFVDVQTDEGNLGSFKISPEEQAASDKAYMKTTVGSPSYDDATASMKEVGKLLGTVSGPALSAARKVGDILWETQPDSQVYNSLKSMLTFAASKDIVQDASFKDALTVSNIAKKSPDQAAYDILDGMAKSFVGTKMNLVGDFMCDTDSMEAMHKILALCGPEAYDRARNKEACVSRLQSVLVQLPTIGQSPFRVSEVTPTEITLENVIGDSIGDYLTEEGFEEYTQLLENLETDMANFDAAAQSQSKYELEDAYVNAVSTLDSMSKTLDEAFASSFYTESAPERQKDAKLDSDINNAARRLGDPDLKDCLASRIKAIVPVLRSSPELMNCSIVDIMNAGAYASRIPGELSADRTAGKDYNAGAGKGRQIRYGEDEYEDELTPDYIGEKDDRSGEMLTNSIDVDMLKNFDANESDVYVKASTDFPMFCYIKADPSGMHSGKGNFSPESGLNPVELYQVAKALDSAHHVVSNIGDVSGKNIAVRETTKNKDYVLEQAIDAFYGFMSSHNNILNRNIIRDAKDVSALLSKVVEDNGDIGSDAILRRVENAFNKVASDARTDIQEGETVDDLTSLIEDIAVRMATVVANIVLYLDSYLTKEMPADDVYGLERYGDFIGSQDRYNDTALADTFASTSVVNPGTMSSNEQNAKTRSKTAMTTEIQNKFRDMTLAGLDNSQEFAETLDSIYERLGKGANLGFAGAISPFDDLISKAKVKHEGGYTDSIYGGEATTNLCAALVYAIISDERAHQRRNGTGYVMLRSMLQKLIGQNGTQQPIALPEYVINGLSLTTDSENPQLDFNKKVWVMFDEKGNAVPSASEDEPNFPTPLPAFDGKSEIGDAIGIGISDSDSIKGIASMIRSYIIERKIDDSASIAALERDDAGTDRRLHGETIRNFKNTMRVAARATMNDTDMFVPLSVLYMCLDDAAINSAKYSILLGGEKTERGRQNTNAANNIMKAVYGDMYGEVPDIKDLSDAHIEFLKKDFANALGILKNDQSSMSEKVRKAITAPVVNEVDGENTPIPDSSLRDILGEDVAKNSLAILQEQIPIDVLSTMTAADITDRANSYVDSIVAKGSAADTGEPLSEIADAATDVATGNMSTEEGVAKILSLLGTTIPMVAYKVFAEMFKELGLQIPRDGNIRIDGHISEARIHNAALSAVDKLLHKHGEFRNLYFAKYNTDDNRELRARTSMHGTVRPYGVDEINGVNGLSVMYKKVEDVLNGTTDLEEGISLLNDIPFNINGCLGKNAIQQFNKYYDMLRKKLSGLMRSTFNGVSAKISLANAPEGQSDAARSSLTAKVNRNMCGVGARDTAGAGKDRIAQLNGLKETVEDIMDSIGTDPDDCAGAFEAAVNAFVDENCYWSDSMSAEELADVQRKTNPLRNTEAAAKFVDLRNAMAAAFAGSKSRYDRNAVTAVGIASASTGVGDEMVINQELLVKLLNEMAKIPGSPIKPADSDMWPEGFDYTIDGKPATRNTCMKVLNHALLMYCEEPSKMMPTVTSMMNTEFFTCVRRSASMKKDLALMTDSLVAFLITSMTKRNFISASSHHGCVRTKHLVRKRYYSSKWFTFDIPVSYIRDVAANKIRGTKHTESLNEWMAFADEMAKYTNTGNRLNQFTISNPALGNQLWDIYNKIIKTISTKVDGIINDMSDDEYRSLCNGEPYTSEDNIRISVSGGGQAHDMDNAFPERTGNRDDYTDEERINRMPFPERLPGAAPVPAAPVPEGDEEDEEDVPEDTVAPAEAEPVQDDEPDEPEQDDEPEEEVP